LSAPIGPLRFERHFVEKVWGGRSLASRPGIELPPDVPIGETWEIVDREKENSIVAGGPFAGRSLRDVMGEHGEALLGKAPAGKEGRFPLLVKYIDAAQDLSVQVHPDDDAAATIGGGAEGKTEAWLVVDVAPGGVLYAGLDPAVERDGFEEAARRDPSSVVDALLRWEVRPGDCLLVPGGTVHAIGAGVTILEVQQNSDTTYRLWDWGRVGLDGQPRETHVPQALAATRFGEPERPPVAPVWEPWGDGARRAALVRSRHFAMNGLGISAERRVSTGSQFQIYAVLGGGGRLSVDGGEGSWTLAQGDVWLVPACAGYHRLAPEGDGELLVAQITHRG